MIIILAILAATHASPLGQSSSLVYRDKLQPPSCDDPQGCRSLWDIIRSCALTIFLCTWASIHPNIPSPDERWPRIAFRRLGLMFGALMVPEVIIAWALRERLAAVELADKYKEEGWTTTHGFFAIMGGFMEYDGNRPIRVLLPEQLESYSLTGNGDFPRISKADIDDKSKGDAVSKTVVVLQTGWFVTQCIVRGIQGLPITELELVTVAFATLNFLIYLLWLDKPLNVQRGVRVYKKRITEEHTDDGNVEAAVGFWVALRDTLPGLRAAIVHGPVLGDDDLDDSHWLARVIFWPITKPFSIMFGEDQKYENLKRVNTVYSRQRDGIPRRGAFLVAAIASVFGGIHCVGWSFTFPSRTEQILWRAASVTIAAVPIVLFSHLLALSDTRGMNGTLDWFLMISAVIQLFLYIISRLA